jgi:plastocyanin
LLSLNCGSNTHVDLQLGSNSEEASFSSGVQSNSITISILDNGFTPSEIVINSGDTVTWVNIGSKSHTSTSWLKYQDENATEYVDLGKLWNSGDIKPGQSFTRTFSQAGKYEYLSFPVYFYTEFKMQPIGTVIVSD